MLTQLFQSLLDPVHLKQLTQTVNALEINESHEM